jgi:hypothetical protein
VVRRCTRALVRNDPAGKFVIDVQTP